MTRRRIRHAFAAASILAAVLLLALAPSVLAADGEPDDPTPGLIALLIITLIGIVVVAFWVASNRRQKPPAA